ncbi:hypothetical protein Fot_01370 [Forsythia ovata]|uniref:Uncharacterized protein n=1 Tax=Forsythia ovata TaxID=205694 RepID=A0ABD1X3R9_9LAMI
MATYVNLYKWLESVAEFVKSVGAIDVHGGSRLRFRMVDSILCRQMYPRSYTFFRIERVSERTKKCFRRVKHRMAAGKEKKEKSPGNGGYGGVIVGKKFLPAKISNTWTARIHLLCERALN